MTNSNRTGYEAVPIEDAPLHTPPQRAQSNRRSSRSLTPCAIFLVVIILILLALIVFFSPNPFSTTFFLFLAILPCVISIYLIAKYLVDDSMPTSFLVTQFTIGALPLVFFVIIAEYFSTVVFAVSLFSSEFSRFQKLIENIPGSTPGDNITPEQMISILNQILESIPVWKFVLALLFTAYITAALMEEAGKWIVARRYRNLIIDSIVEEAPVISFRSVLASACMAATGFAAMENIGYILSGRNVSGGISLSKVGTALLRGILAFPVHIGTQFYIAVTAARYVIFHEQSKVFRAFLVAVLFHGTFDAVAFGIGALVGLAMIPEWFNILVVIFDFALIAVLGGLCMQSFKDLKDKEGSSYSAV